MAVTVRLMLHLERLELVVEEVAGMPLLRYSFLQVSVVPV